MAKTKKDIVIEALRKHVEGLTIAEIANILTISRNTVAVAVAELKGAEQIRIRPIGKAKLIYWIDEADKAKV